MILAGYQYVLEVMTEHPIYLHIFGFCLKKSKMIKKLEQYNACSELFPYK